MIVDGCARASVFFGNTASSTIMLVRGAAAAVAVSRFERSDGRRPFFENDYKLNFLLKTAAHLD